MGIEVDQILPVHALQAGNGPLGIGVFRGKTVGPVLFPPGEVIAHNAPDQPHRNKQDLKENDGQAKMDFRPAETFKQARAAEHNSHTQRVQRRAHPQPHRTPQHIAVHRVAQLVGDDSYDLVLGKLVQECVEEHHFPGASQACKQGIQFAGAGRGVDHRDGSSVKTVGRGQLFNSAAQRTWGQGPGLVEEPNGNPAPKGPGQKQHRQAGRPEHEQKCPKPSTKAQVQAMGPTHQHST